MQAYLEWEHGLVAQLERDGAHGFAVLTPDRQPERGTTSLPPGPPA
jgi:hypothetical protein